MNNLSKVAGEDLLKALKEKDYDRADRIADFVWKNDTGFDAKVTDELGKTALHYAAESERPGSAVRFINLLLRNGADINAVDKNKETPLHIAAKRGKLHIVKVLLRRNASADLCNKDGKTALEVTNKVRHSDVANFLGGEGGSAKIAAAKLRMIELFKRKRARDGNSEQESSVVPNDREEQQGRWSLGVVEKRKRDHELSHAEKFISEVKASSKEPTKGAPCSR